MNTKEILQSAGKICTGCGHEFPATVDYFYKHSAGKNGLSPECKRCVITRTKINKQKPENKERYRLYGQKHQLVYQLTEQGKTVRRRSGKKYYATIRGHLSSVFKSAKRRCINHTDRSYKNYGGRGIEVRFKSFNEFVDYIINELQVDPRGLTIDRIDNDGNYEPGNIRFITNRENQRNKKRVV